MLNYKSFRFLILLLSIGLSFASCENDDTTDTLINQDTPPTLNGTYVLTSLEADVAVDLNNDSTTNTNLLEESDCFDVMEVTFVNDGTFTATNSKLDFNGGASGAQLTCTTRTDEGSWELQDSQLTLTVIIAGNTITETKTIFLTNTSFSFTATDVEIDAYVEDNGSSSASAITELFLEYTK